MQQNHTISYKEQYPALIVILGGVFFITLPLIIKIVIPVYIYIFITILIAISGYFVLGPETFIVALLFLSQGIVTNTNPYNYKKDFKRLFGFNKDKSITEVLNLADGEIFHLKNAVIKFDLAGHYIIKQKKRSGIDHKYYIFPVVSARGWTPDKPVFLVATCYNYFEQPLCFKRWKDVLRYDLKIYSKPGFDELKYAQAILDARKRFGLKISSEVRFVEPVNIKYRAWHPIYQLSLYLLLIAGIIYTKKNKITILKKGINNE